SSRKVPLPIPSMRAAGAPLTGAHSARKASPYLILLAGLVPWLQFEISRIGRRAAEREWDAVVKLEVDEQRLVQFQLVNEHDLDARRVARRRADGLRPAGDANGLAELVLSHGGIEREIGGEGGPRRRQ